MIVDKDCNDDADDNDNRDDDNNADDDDADGDDVNDDDDADDERRRRWWRCVDDVSTDKSGFSRYRRAGFFREERKIHPH